MDNYRHRRVHHRRRRPDHPAAPTLLSGLVALEDRDARSPNVLLWVETLASRKMASPSSRVVPFTQHRFSDLAGRRSR